MTAAGHRVETCPKEMHILVFTVQGVIMGVDTSQIEEMLEVEEAAARGLRIRPLHEEFSFGFRPVTYKAPKVITIKGRGAEGDDDHRDSLAALIDRPDRIADVTVDSIQGVPSLIAARPGASRAIWGVVVGNRDVILLLDLLKLPQGRGSAPEKPETWEAPKTTEGL
jgi:chemotaxis signal transduction protein